MKVYMLSKHDFDNLLARIDRDPSHGYDGGSSNAMSEHDRRIHDEAHRFFNYQIRTWISDVQRDDEASRG
jgi:hypothetical protein